MKIVTAVVNNPIFIEIQYYTLKKYFKGDYEFIVFNDAKDFPDYTNSGDVTIKKQIETVCFNLKIQCINIPHDNNIQKNRNACLRCYDAMNYILEYQKQNLDEYLFLDSDMFLIDYFDINKYENYDCAVVLQSRNNFTVNYFWNGLYYFNMKKMKNIELLNWDCVDEKNLSCDVGGMMKEWLKTQMIDSNIPSTDDIRWKNETFHTDNFYFIKHLWSCSWNISELPKNLQNDEKLLNFLYNDPRNENGKFFCEIYDNVFLHYRAGGNWRGEGINTHIKLAQLLKESLL